MRRLEASFFWGLCLIALIVASGCSDQEPRASFDVSITETSDKVVIKVICGNGYSSTDVDLDSKNAVDDYIKEIEFLLSRLREAGEKMRSHEMELIDVHQKEIQKILGEQHAPPVLPKVRKDN